MATLYGSNSQLRINNPVDKVRVSQLGGRVRVSYDKFVGDAAQNDVVVMGSLPKGARVHSVMLKHTALGASVTAEVGYLGATLDSNDAFATAYDISGAGTTTIVAPTDELSEAVDIVVTLEGANPASGTVEVIAFYSVD